MKWCFTHNQIFNFYDYHFKFSGLYIVLDHYGISANDQCRAYLDNSWNALSLASYVTNILLLIESPAGHHNYLKSMYFYTSVYTDSVCHLKIQSFTKCSWKFGSRSDRTWAGLGADFVIAQVLIRTLKSRGGLTK